MMCINKLEHSNTIKQPKLLSHHCATMLTGFENYNRKMGFGPSMHPEMVTVYQSKASRLIGTVLLLIKNETPIVHGFTANKNSKVHGKHKFYDSYNYNLMEQSLLVKC